MNDVWTFGKPLDSTHNYADGTIVPHRDQVVYLNSVPIGELEIHMHKRRGDDGLLDVSFGITTIVYGPAPGGK